MGSPGEPGSRKCSLVGDQWRRRGGVTADQAKHLAHRAWIVGGVGDRYQGQGSAAQVSGQGHGCCGLIARSACLGYGSVFASADCEADWTALQERAPIALAIA